MPAACRCSPEPPCDLYGKVSMSKSNSIIPAREITAGAEKASPLIPARTFDRGQRERLSLQRTVAALRGPEGTPVDLPEGDEAIAFQALGGGFSIEDRGQLYRTDGTQADAPGRASRTLAVCAAPTG